jgi:hypothetical protein
VPDCKRLRKEAFVIAVPEGGLIARLMAQTGRSKGNAAISRRGMMLGRSLVLHPRQVHRIQIPSRMQPHEVEFESA